VTLDHSFVAMQLPMGGFKISLFFSQLFVLSLQVPSFPSFLSSFLSPLAGPSSLLFSAVHYNVYHGQQLVS
jgi:hypothetical protein